MTLDGITLLAITNELAKRLENAKIEKISMPVRDEVVLLLHTFSGKARLLLSASASDARIHLTSRVKENPAQAPNFCMLLRKRIGNGRILSVFQRGLDRIVDIRIAARDELGVPTEYTLVLEMMGKHSNLILVDANGKIADSIKHVSFDVSSVRQVLPQMTYQAPPAGKLDPLTASEESIADVLSRANEANLADKLAGISRQAASEILYRRYGEELPETLSDNAAFKLAQHIKEFIGEVVSDPRPCLQFNGTKPVFFSALPFRSMEGGARTEYDSPSLMLDEYYRIREHVLMLEQKRTSLNRDLRHHRTKAEKKLYLRRNELIAGEKARDMQIMGELIIANMHAIKRGTEKARLFDYYTGKEIDVPLDVKISPAANAQKYFKRAAKAKTAAALAAEQCDALEAELAFIEDLEYTVSKAASMEELAAVTYDMQRFGYIKKDVNRKNKAASRPAALPPRRFRSKDGYEILVGRNSRSNDTLSLRIAEGDDIWLHTKNIPGSHVILRTRGEAPTDQALSDAATIAATLSAARAKTEVDYTLAKNVWKANGAPPGIVHYKAQKTVIFSPDEAYTESLALPEEEE